jgi:hypothetical protein
MAARAIFAAAQDAWAFRVINTHGEELTAFDIKNVHGRI